MAKCNCGSCQKINDKRGYWRSQDGRYTKITDLKTDHLLNVVALLQRSPGNQQRYKIISLKKELVKRLTNELESLV